MLQFKELDFVVKTSHNIPKQMNYKSHSFNPGILNLLWYEVSDEVFKSTS